MIGLREAQTRLRDTDSLKLSEGNDDYIAIMIIWGALKDGYQLCRVGDLIDAVSENECFTADADGIINLLEEACK